MLTRVDVYLITQQEYTKQLYGASMTLTRIYDYDLPEDLIAQEPLSERDRSRMLLIDRRTSSISHRNVRDLPAILSVGDLLIMNNTKVVRSRLRGAKTSGGKLDVLFIEEVEQGLWRTLIKSSRRPRRGSNFSLANGEVVATVVKEGVRGEALLRVESQRPMNEVFDEHGSTPLPPYIKRDGDSVREELDQERYQTIYADTPGAVAAPTAGLHFTQNLLQTLQGRGVNRANLTLHVGPGTFRPVSAEHLEDHVMDSERFSLSIDSASDIRNCTGRRIAVGSTSVRTLETIYAERGCIEPYSGRSSLYIYPPYDFKVVDAMLTNFHLPCSTLLMMVCAFAGHDLVMRAYREAVERKYRFYSYGDCMLII